MTESQRAYTKVVKLWHDPGLEKTYWRGWNGKVECIFEVLDKPLHWRKPRRIFVCSMGDLFHPDVPFEFITRIFDVMCSWRWANKADERDGDESRLINPGHTYQVLTKRPERIQLWLDWVAHYWPGDSAFNICADVGPTIPGHIWLGTTCENQEMADKRIPHLLKVSAAIRFISAEPLLEAMDIELVRNRPCPHPGCLNHVTHPCEVCGYQRGRLPIDWVIIGCETGPKRRPCKIEWVRDLVGQCDAAGVPVFIKQLDLNGRVSKDPAEWPDDLRRREKPK